MKKFIITVLLLTGLTVNRAVAGTFTIISPTEKQEKVFSKIDTNKVPAAVLKEISDKYEGYNVSGAYTSEDGEYKLELAKENTVITVYYNTKGEFVKEKK